MLQTAVGSTQPRQVVEQRTFMEPLTAALVLMLVLCLPPARPTVATKNTSSTVVAVGGACCLPLALLMN